MDDKQLTGYNLPLNEVQMKTLTDILFDYGYQVEAAIAYGTNAKIELEKMVEAGENDESKAAAQKGIDAINTDFPKVLEAKERWIELKQHIEDLTGITIGKDVKDDNSTGSTDTNTDGEEPVHTAGEEVEAVSGTETTEPTA